eukprot:880102-Prymnesium_polylepis.1
MYPDSRVSPADATQAHDGRAPPQLRDILSSVPMFRRERAALRLYCSDCSAVQAVDCMRAQQ